MFRTSMSNSSSGIQIESDRSLYKFFSLLFWINRIKLLSRNVRPLTHRLNKSYTIEIMRPICNSFFIIFFLFLPFFRFLSFRDVISAEMAVVSVKPLSPTSSLLHTPMVELYYIGKLRSLIDIGDTGTSRKRFSCTEREILSWSE